MVHYNFSFIVIADPHVGLEGYGYFLEDFNVIIKQINDLTEKPDFVWILGDIDGVTESAYSDFNMPVHVVFGNSESMEEREKLRKIFPELEKDYFSFKHKGCLFVGLCNAIYVDHIGHLQSEYIHPGQIKWFEQKLANNYQEASNIFVFAHIPIGPPQHPVSSLYLAENDRKYIVGLIKKYKPTAFFFGHLHRKEEFKIGRTQLITIPSCNYAWSRSTPPCFLRVKVYPGRIETEYILVSKIKHE